MALYVVTGGAGFIGSHLVDALIAEGHSVRVVDDLSSGHVDNLDDRADLIVGDVADAELMRSALAGADACFHLAAVASVQRAHDDWLGAHRSNLTGAISVLDAARDAGRLPVVYASSAAVYGEQGRGAIAETAPPRPISAYGADKLGAELHAAVGLGVHGVPTTGLRLFNVYGPRQDLRSPYTGVISIFATRIAAGQAVTVNGDGQQMRDFIYVGDVVRLLRAAMQRLGERPRASVYNACTGRGTTVLDLAHTLAGAAGVPPRIGYGPERPGDITCSLGDPTLATAMLGISADTDLAEGLGRTFAALRGELCHAGALPLVA